MGYSRVINAHSVPAYANYAVNRSSIAACRNQRVLDGFGRVERSDNRTSEGSIARGDIAASVGINGPNCPTPRKKMQKPKRSLER